MLFSINLLFDSTGLQQGSSSATSTSCKYHFPQRLRMTRRTLLAWRIRCNLSKFVSGRPPISDISAREPESTVWPPMELDASTLIDSLPKELRDRVRNIYLIGSRAWRPQSATPTTDFDFHLVIEDYEGPEHGVHPDLPGFPANVDVSAYSCETWKNRVLSHETLSLMCSYFPRVQIMISIFTPAESDNPNPLVAFGLDGNVSSP